MLWHTPLFVSFVPSTICVSFGVLTNLLPRCIPAKLEVLGRQRSLFVCCLSLWFQSLPASMLGYAGGKSTDWTGGRDPLCWPVWGILTMKWASVSTSGSWSGSKQLKTWFFPCSLSTHANTILKNDPILVTSVLSSKAIVWKSWYLSDYSLLVWMRDG